MKKFIVVMLLFLLQGCATNVSLNPVSRGAQECVYKRGNPALVSNMTHSVALGPLSSTFESGERASLAVVVVNRGSEPFDLSIEDIEIRTDSEILHVVTYEEREDEIKTAQAWASFAAALSNAGKQMSASANAYKTQYGTSTATAYNSYGGSAYGVGTYSATTYDYAAAQEARDRADSEYNSKMQEINADTQQKLSQIGGQYLRRNTVAPGQSYGGMFLVELPSIRDASTIYVNVSAGADIHSFEFSYDKIER